MGRIEAMRSRVNLGFGLAAVYYLCGKVFLLPAWGVPLAFRTTDVVWCVAALILLLVNVWRWRRDCGSI